MKTQSPETRTGRRPGGALCALSRIVLITGISFAACAGGAFAQTPANPPGQAPADQTPHAWRKADPSAAAGQNTAPAPENNQLPAPNAAQDNNVAPAQNEPTQESAAPPPAGEQGAPASPDAQAGQPQSAPYPPPGNSIPASLTIAPGTYVTVRVNGWLSSDRNQAGDAFTATLAQPLIVNGIVVAQRGQTVGGVVTEAKKAGRIEGTSSLGLKLTDITLVDGQKVNLQTSMVTRSGDTSAGVDAAAIGGTTALGAAIGAAADWGRGAAIGAGAGAAAGIIGVLLTRGRPTIVYPETALTFRVDAPVNVDTTHAPQAFRYADESDYGRPAYSQPPPRTAGPCYGAGCPAPPPPPYYAPAYVPYYAPYPWYWGPGFAFYVGPRFYYGPRVYVGRFWYRRR